MSQRWRFVLFAFIIASLFALQWFDFSFISLKNIPEYAHVIDKAIAYHYFTSVFIFMLVFVSATVMCIPITAILTIAAGYFFGIVLGLAYVFISMLIGSVVVFLMVRYLLGEWVQKKYVYQLKRFNSHIKKYGVYYVIVGNLLPGPPIAVFSFMGALSQLSIYEYISALLLGTFPGTLVYTWVGYRMRTSQSVTELLFVICVTALVFIVSGLFFFVLKKLKRA